MLLLARDIRELSGLRPESIPYGGAPSKEQASYLDSLAGALHSAGAERRVIAIAPADEENPAGKFISVQTASFADVDDQYGGRWGAVVARNDFGGKDNIMLYIACSYLGGLIPDGVVKFAVLVGTARHMSVMSYLPEMASLGVHLVNAFGMPGAGNIYDPLHSEGVAAGNDRPTWSGLDAVLVKCDEKRVSAFSQEQRMAAALFAFAKQWGEDAFRSWSDDGELTRDLLDVSASAVAFYSKGRLRLPDGLEELCGKLPYPLSSCVLPPLSEKERQLEDVLNKTTALQQVYPMFYELSGFTIAHMRASLMMKGTLFSQAALLTGCVSDGALACFCERPFSMESVRRLLDEARRGYFESDDLIGIHEEKAVISISIPPEIAEMFPEKGEPGRSPGIVTTNAASLLSTLVEFLCARQKGGPSTQAPCFSFSLLYPNSGYDAVTEQGGLGQRKIPEAEAARPEGDWGILLVEGREFVLNAGLCAVAAGLVPDGVGRAVVVGGDWGMLSPEALEDVRQLVDEILAEGCHAISDLSDLGIGGFGERGLKSRIEYDESTSYGSGGMTRSRVGKLVSPDMATEEIRDALKPAWEYARQYDVARMVGTAISNGGTLFSSDVMDFMSMGMARHTDCAGVMEHPGFRGEDIRHRLPMLDIVYPYCRTALPEWASPAMEFADLCSIWRHAAKSANLGLKQFFPEGVSRKACYAIARELGVPSMLEAYYAGVPLEDIVGE